MEHLPQSAPRLTLWSGSPTTLTVPSGEVFTSMPQAS
jgi:hypothetical protein